MTAHYDERGGPHPPERLLLVTADESFGAALTTELDRDGRLIEIASTAADVPDQLDRTWYDGVVVDGGGPNDAVSLARTVREAHPQLPIVACAGGDDGSLASDVLDAGATTFVLRDDPTMVVERLQSVLGSHRSNAIDRDTAEINRTVVQDALAAADVGLVVSDGEGTVRWASDAIGGLFGHSAADLVGEQRRAVVRQRLGPTAVDSSALTNYLLAPDSAPGVLVRTDGVDDGRWLDCQSNSLYGGPFAGGRVDRFVDVTRSIRSNDGLRELQRLMVLDESSFAERLHEVLALGVERFDLPYGFVTAIEDGTQDVLDAVGDHELLQPGESAPLLQTYCRRTLAAESLVTIPDAVEAGWSNDPAYRTFELGAYIGAPIVVDGEQYGTLCFASSEPRDSFDDEDELFVRFAAAWAGWELERYGSKTR